MLPIPFSTHLNGYNKFNSLNRTETNMNKMIGLMTSLTLIASLAACSSNAKTDQQASPSTSPNVPAASTTQSEGDAMKGDAMKGDAMHKGDAMKKDTTTKP